MSSKLTIIADDIHFSIFETMQTISCIYFMDTIDKTAFKTCLCSGLAWATHKYSPNTM